MRRSSQLVVLGVVLLVGVSLWFAFHRNPYKQALGSRSLATWGLAQELARRYPNTRALVISNPFAQKSGIRKEIQAVEEAGVAGLKEGFGQTITLEAVVFPEIRPEAKENPRAVHIPDTTTPLSYLAAEDAFDRLAQEHTSCELVVSLIGLPADLAKVRVWQQTGTPRFALLLPDLRVIGNAAAVRAALQSEKLAAFVIPSPTAPPEQTPVRADKRAEFEKRYILVTRENFEDVLSKHRALLGVR